MKKNKFTVEVYKEYLFDDLVDIWFIREVYGKPDDEKVVKGKMLYYFFQNKKCFVVSTESEGDSIFICPHQDVAFKKEDRIKLLEKINNKKD